MTAWTMKLVASSWVVPMQLVYRFHGTPSRSHYHGGILDHHSQASCFLHQCTKRILIWSRSRFWTLSLTESKVTLRFSPYRISRWAISPLVSHENPGKEALIFFTVLPHCESVSFPSAFEAISSKDFWIPQTTNTSFGIFRFRFHSCQSPLHIITDPHALVRILLSEQV